jgi:hypothetical protein
VLRALRKGHLAARWGYMRTGAAAPARLLGSYMAITRFGPLRDAKGQIF